MWRKATEEAAGTPRVGAHDTYTTHVRTHMHTHALDPQQGWDG